MILGLRRQRVVGLSVFLKGVSLVLFVRRVGHERDYVGSASADAGVRPPDKAGKAVHLFAILAERLVLVDVAQEHEDRAEEESEDGDADVEGQETDGIDHTAGDDGPDGVGERIGNVGDGVDASVDADVADVDDVAHSGQKGRVDEGDAETDAANWDHEDPIGAGEGDDETTEAFQGQPEGGHDPGVLRIAGGHADGDDDSEDVREESRQPNHAQLPLFHIHRVHHPDGNGGLEEGQRDVGHHQSAGTDGDVRVHQ